MRGGVGQDWCAAGPRLLSLPAGSMRFQWRCPNSSGCRQQALLPSLPALRLGCELALSEMLWGQKAVPRRAGHGETPCH